MRTSQRIIQQAGKGLLAALACGSAMNAAQAQPPSNHGAPPPNRPGDNRPNNNGFDYAGQVADVSVTASTLTLRDPNTLSLFRTFNVLSSTRVSVDGQPAMFRDLKVGMDARLEVSSNLGIISIRAINTNPRQQTNEISAFLDGSVIYGSDPTRAAALRTFSGGLLKTSAGDLMPLNTNGLPNANDAHFFPDNTMFLSGDVRANENVELSAVHVLWLREHNRIAKAISAQNPRLSDELVYQWARQIVGAEVQVITFKEFLPAFIGGAVRSYGGYDPRVNPGIANEFSGAAFRVGHTLINDDVEFLDNDGNDVRDELELAEAFFNPAPLVEVGPDPLLKYLATDNAHEVDLKLVEGLRNFLFGPPGSGGFDLAARNIQRGRDHGLADYNTTRAVYGLGKVRDFSQVSSDGGVQEQLRALYGNVDNIDLWVGGLAEDHAPGASIGPTFQRIIADQFERTRVGDGFWYQNVFSGEALRILEGTRLSDVIKRNTGITKLQDNVFFFHAGSTSFTPDPRRAVPSVERLVQTAAPLLSQMKAFRAFDGSNNNRQNPTWGQAGIRLLRAAPAAYGDGFSTPSGANRPSARLISNALCVQGEEADGAPRNDRSMSDWVYAWGQFVDHDLDLTTTGGTPFDIAIPLGDPYFDPKSTGTKVMPLDRSTYDPTTGIPLAPNANPTPEPRPRGGASHERDNAGPRRQPMFE